MKELLISIKIWLKGTERGLRNWTRLRKKITENKPKEDKDQTLKYVARETSAPK